MSCRITALDLAIAIDTLVGSARIADETGIWNYTNEARKLASQALCAQLADIEVAIAEVGLPEEVAKP